MRLSASAGLLAGLLCTSACAFAATAQDKAAAYRQMLLTKTWWQGNAPAAHLPSDWARCETQGAAVLCQSSPAVNAASGEQRRYQVRTRLDGFDDRGRFQLHLDADVQQTPAANAAGSGPRLEWAAKEIWDCRFQGWEVNCFVNGKHVVQYTHQPLQTMGNGGLTVSPPAAQ
jgi:hypothetical protein